MRAAMKMTPRNVDDAQHYVLRQLLKKAQHTQFGEHYDFKGILQSKEVLRAFQQAVPIHDYDSIYASWWKRALGDETDVAWPGRIRHFALSSGTSGAPSKHIPITAEMIKAIRNAGLDMFACIYQYNVPDSFYSMDMMMLGGSTSLEDKGGYFVGDLSGITTSQTPLWLRRFYKPGFKIAALKDYESRINEIARQANKWNIGSLMGIPAWNKLMLERVIEFNNLDNIHEIWPNLQFFVHGGVAFEPYRKGFERLMGKPIHYMDTYMASEGFVAFQCRPDTSSMRMVVDNGIFYEFVPFDDEHFDEDGVIRPGAKAYGIIDVEEGIDYALLLSTCAGAWRYQVGDTVKFTDKARSEIIITGRTKHFLSYCGEHVSVDNLNQAIQMAQDQMGIRMEEFTVAGIKTDGYFAHHWYVACDEKVNEQELMDLLDRNLMKLNDDYRTEREVVLKAPKIKVLPLHTFYDFMASLGKMGGQNKFPRVLKGKQYKEWRAFLDQLNPV